MATLARRVSLRPRATFEADTRMPLWMAVVYSRLFVLAAGATGALLTHGAMGWERSDPSRLSSSLGSVGNVLAASTFRWDGVDYVSLAEHGYGKPGQIAFFPFYSILIRAVTLVVRSPVLAGVLISLAAFAIGLTLVHRIAAEEIGPRAARTTVLLLAFSPFSFVFSAVYTASLVLALAAGALYLARRGRFVLAGVAAACAAITHIEGILLVAPLALMYWKSRGRPSGLRPLLAPELVGLALPPLTLGGFLLYLHLQGWGWLAPITSQNMANVGRSLLGPPAVWFDAIRAVVVDAGQSQHPALVSGTQFAPLLQNTMYLSVLVIALLGLVVAWQKLPREYAIFGALAILICTSSAIASEPLKGLDRYMLPIFPLWIGAASWLAERQRWTAPVLTVSAALLAFYTVEFARWVSVF